MNKYLISVCMLIIGSGCWGMNQQTHDFSKVIQDATESFQPDVQQLIFNIRTNAQTSQNVDSSPQTNVQNNNTAQNETKVKTEVTNKIMTYLQQISEQVQKISPRDMANTAGTYLQAYKWYIIGGSAITAYLSLCSFLLYGNLFLEKTTTWSAWKKHLSIEELHAIPQDQLGRDLVCDIEQRHVNVKNPTDHILPLVRFIKAVDHEMKILKIYIAIASACKTTRIIAITPSSEARLEHARAARTRLMFVKHVFISWSANDNLKNFHH